MNNNDETDNNNDFVRGKQLLARETKKLRADLADIEGDSRTQRLIFEHAAREQLRLLLEEVRREIGAHPAELVKMVADLTANFAAREKRFIELENMISELRSNLTGISANHALLTKMTEKFDAVLLVKENETPRWVKILGAEGVVALVAVGYGVIAAWWTASRLSEYLPLLIELLQKQKPLIEEFLKRVG